MRFREIHIRVALFAAAALTMLWGYRLLIGYHAPGIFMDPYEDLSYGWYVPIFSLYVLWRERRETAASVGAPSAMGLIVLLPALLLGFIGARGSQIRFEIVGFVGSLIGLVWCSFGAKTMRRTLFPFLFLLFCIPLHSFLDVVTIHLRLLAVSFSYEVLRGCGVDIIREGTMLTSSTGSFAIDVAEPCSGLRSLFAMMALVVGYGYFTQPTWGRRLALFVCAVPIAVLGNIVRILSIVCIAATCSSDFATGFYHDYSGYVVFLVAISLMVAAGGLIGKVRGEATDEDVRCPSGGGRSSQPPTTNLAFLLLVIFFCSCMVYQGLTVEPTLCEAPTVRLGELPDFKSEVLPVSEAELHTLPDDTIIDKRLYTDGNGVWYQVSLVIGGRSKSSIHRPELCLPSQGFQMADPRTIEVDDIDWHVVSLTRGAVPEHVFAYTFFNQAGYRTSSHLRRIFRDVLDRSLLSRIDRWAMLTVSAGTADERRLRDFLSRFTEFVK